MTAQLVAKIESGHVQYVIDDEARKALGSKPCITITRRRGYQEVYGPFESAAAALAFHRAQQPTRLPE